MALALFDRVQETTTTTGTGSITLAGAVPGFQSFAVVGNGNTCYYTIVDNSAWEVGVGTYSTSGPTLARTTILSNSNGNTTAITLAAGTKSVFLTYPASKSVNLNESGNVSALGTVASGTWQGSTIGVAYGGTGVTASTGANSVVLRDANGNITVNRLSQELQTITASGGTTVLTAASDFNQQLVGTGGHTFRLPDATTLTDTTAFQFNNNATGTLTIQNNASAVIGTVAPGGAAGIALMSNATVAGTWDVHGYIPENVTWGTNSLALGSTVITGGTWNGGTITSAYGGTGLTTFTAANNALYSTSAGALAAGTLPVLAGGTGATTAAGAQSSLNVPSTTGSGASGTWGISITGSASGSSGSVVNAATFNSGGAGDASGTTFNGSAARTISYNTIGAPSTTGTNASGTWNISISGNAATATTAANYVPLAGGTMSGNLTVTRILGVNSLVLNTYTTVNPASNVYLYSPPNDRDAWIYLDSADTGSNWGIYHRQIDTAVSGLPANSIGFIGGGTSALQAWISLANGSANFAGALTQGGNQVLHAGNYNSYAPTLTGGGASGTWGINITGNAASATTAGKTSATTVPASTAFSKWLFATNSTSGTLDWNDSSNTIPGVGTTLLLGTATNGPGGSNYYHPFNIEYSGINGTGNVTQMAVAYGSPANELYMRGSYGGSWSSWVRFLNSSNYNSYAPTLTGGGASGTWGINITGSAGSAGSASTASRVTGGNLNPAGVAFNNALISAGGSNRVVTFDGNGSTPSVWWSSGSRAYGAIDALDPGLAFWANNGSSWQQQMAVNYGNVTINTDIRSPIFYDSNNTAYYLDPASTSELNKVYYNSNMVSRNYGIGQIGLYSSTRFQAVFSMGESYILPADGTSAGNLYGIAWSYPSAGGVAANLNTHGALFLENGGFLAAISGSIRCRDDMRAPIFYDSNNTGYYLDPASTSNLNRLLIQPRIDNYYVGNVSSTDPVSNWQSLTDTTGQFIVSQFNNITSGAFTNYPPSVYTYGSVISTRTANHSFQLYTSHTGDITYKTQWNNDNYSGWLYPMVYGRSNGAGGSVYGTIFYDSNDTAYYVDPNSSGTCFKGYGTVDSRTGFISTSNPWGTANSAYFPNGISTAGGTNWIYGFTYIGNAPSNGAGHEFNTDGSMRSTGSHRASIYYDDSNTGYYVDPASTSRMGTINADVLYSYGNVTAYSDERLKKDWEILPADFVEKLANVKSGTYTRIDSGERQVGVGAQSLQAVLKEAVSDSQEYLGVNYGNAALVSAVELAKYVTALEQRISQLEARL